MKKILLLPILFFSISCFADVYMGSFNFNRVSYNLKYEFDASNKNNLKGTFEPSRTGRGNPCWQGIKSINGSKIDGANVILIATPSPEQEGMNCDVYEFEGKVEGNTLVGKFKFGANMSDVVLTKQ